MIMKGTELIGYKHDTVIQDTLKVGHNYFTASPAQERVNERASERVSAVERASNASSAEQANE